MKQKNINEDIKTQKMMLVKWFCEKLIDWKIDWKYTDKTVTDVHNGTEGKDLGICGKDT